MSLLQETENSHLSGVLLVDKPSGPTSHDIVDTLRKISGISRIGHGGTLDPLASGLLPLFIGDATKMSGFIQSHDKSYEFDITLGVVTDSDDSQGRVMTVNPVPESLTEKNIRETLLEFMGDRLQQPPMHSAVKVKGTPLYKLARKGIEIDRPFRKITIYALECLSLNGSTATLRVHCSKGTYVRVLAREIGEALGCGGHVSRLRRLSVGSFSIKEGHSLHEIASSWTEEDLKNALVGPDRVFQDLPALSLLPHASFLLQKSSLIPGVWIFRKEGLFHATDTIRIKGSDGRILGLAQTLLDSEQTRFLPGGIPIARMVLIFRPHQSSCHGEPNPSSWKGDRVFLNYE